MNLTGEGAGANQFPVGTKYAKFNIAVMSEGPVWFDRAIFANSKTFTYNAANQITNTGFTYDANGNMTSDGTYTYIYDGENRLKEVKQGGNTIASYTYDYMGRRTSVTKSGTTIYFRRRRRRGHEGGVRPTQFTFPEGGVRPTQFTFPAGAQM